MEIATKNVGIPVVYGLTVTAMHGASASPGCRSLLYYGAQKNWNSSFFFKCSGRVEGVSDTTLINRRWVTLCLI